MLGHYLAECNKCKEHVLIEPA